MEWGSVPDGRLVELCRAGDSDAWNELVRRFSRYVHAIAVQGFRLREQDAEDVFQEVFARVYDRLHALRADDAIRPWIAQMTRRLCIDTIRSRSREEPAEEIDEVEAEDRLSLLEEAFDVRRALGGLSGNCRDILDRFFAQDQSYRAIGGDLGLPSGTIASRISRCLGKLRDEIEGRKPAPVESGG